MERFVPKWKVFIEKWKDVFQNDRLSSEKWKDFFENRRFSSEKWTDRLLDYGTQHANGEVYFNVDLAASDWVQAGIAPGAHNSVDVGASFLETTQVTEGPLTLPDGTDLNGSTFVRIAGTPCPPEMLPMERRIVGTVVPVSPPAAVGSQWATPSFGGSYGTAAGPLMPGGKPVAFD